MPPRPGTADTPPGGKLESAPSVDAAASEKDGILRHHSRLFPKGTIVFREGDYGEEVFIIHRGRVRIYKTVRSRDQTLASLDKGEFFGEMAVLDHKPRSASAEAMEDTTLIVLTADQFDRLLTWDRQIALRLIHKLADRLRTADQQIENLLIRDADSRVLNALWKLIPEHGRPTADGIRIQIDPKELLARVGLDADTLKRVLKKLRTFRIIDVAGKTVLIPSLEKFREFQRFLDRKADVVRPG